jgi:hypothetical protein
MGSGAARPMSTETRASPISPGPSPMVAELPVPKAPKPPPLPQHLSSCWYWAVAKRSAQVEYRSTDSFLGTRPVPRFTYGRFSPISFALSPSVLELPYPSTPGLSEFLPQHLTISLSSMAHTCWYPQSISLTVLPVPRLTCGSASPICERLQPPLFVVPVPSCPYSFLPKHFSMLLSSITHVNLSPVSTDMANLPVQRLTAGNASPMVPLTLPGKLFV